MASAADNERDGCHAACVDLAPSLQLAQGMDRMNTDAFIASETVDREAAARYNEPYGVPVERSADLDDYLTAERETNHAANQDMRLKRCGLVFYENQLSSHRYVAPAGKRQADEARLRVIPLYLAKPIPGMEIEALDGEKYLLPKDFKGDWFDVTSETGKKLIGE